MRVNSSDRRTAQRPNRNDAPSLLLPSRSPTVKEQKAKRAGASVKAYADRDEQRKCTSLPVTNGYAGNAEQDAKRSGKASAEQQVWKNFQCRLAHDLNNYVGIVMGRAQLLAEKCATDKRMAEDCSNIISASLRIAALVKKFSL